MIRLQRNRAAIPAKYRGDKLLQLLQNLLAGYYDFQGKVPFNQKKNHFQQWGESKEALKAESHGKCAYCESNAAVVSYGDVEHFRPKDLYWWLAFSYDNYTYSCPLCNQKFKGARFTVAGSRIEPPVKLPPAKPSADVLATLAAQLCPDPGEDSDAVLTAYFANEQADLPHPYLDSPEDLFAWQADDVNREVSLIAKDGGQHALRAIKAVEHFLGLNREDLRRARYATYSLIKAHCLVLQEATKAKTRDHALSELQTAISASQPYAGMARYFLREWGVLA